MTTLCTFVQDIDYEGFKLFMDTYLEVEVHDELCKRLFLSFVKRTPTKTTSNVEGKVIKVQHTPRILFLQYLFSVFFVGRNVATRWISNPARTWYIQFVRPSQ